MGVFRLWELKNGFAISTKMDFYEPESTLRVILVEISTDNIYQSYKSWGVGLSDTKHLCRNAQSCTKTSSPALRHWCGGPSPQYLPRSDSEIWHLIHIWHLALCRACQKNIYIWYSLRGLHQPCHSQRHKFTPAVDGSWSSHLHIGSRECSMMTSNGINLSSLHAANRYGNSKKYY